MSSYCYKCVTLAFNIPMLSLVIGFRRHKADRLSARGYLWLRASVCIDSGDTDDTVKVAGSKVTG